MLLCCRLTAPTLQPLKSMPSTSMSSRIIWRPPSAESWARDCPRVWGRGLPARGSGRSLTWKGCLLSPRAPKYCKRQSWTADTGVNEMLMHETQPTCVVMRAWHSYNLKLVHEVQQCRSLTLDLRAQRARFSAANACTSIGQVFRWSLNRCPLSNCPTD